MMALLMVGASPALYTDYPTHNHDCYEIILNSDPEFQVTQALLATGYSKDHLRRRFVQVTGMTPGQYLRSLRIRKGKQLLEQKALLHLSVSEIAGLCGFYDPSFFCRVFEKEVGMAPSAYSRAAANTI